MKLARLMKYARVPLEMNGRPGDEVAIITDSNTDPLIGESLVACAYQMDMEPNLVMMLPRAMHGNEPTRLVAAALMAADLSVCPTSMGINHTDAARSAVRSGKRVLVMPGATVEMLTEGAATVDPRELKEVTARVAEALSKATRIVVTSEKGTNVTFSLEGRAGLPLDGMIRPGRSAGWPTGEAASAVLESTAEGTIVFDLSVHSVGLLAEPIRLEVREGRVISIRGGVQAKQFEEVISTKGDSNSLAVGEFAIGTNAKARTTGNVTEDKKRLGTIPLRSGQQRHSWWEDGQRYTPTMASSLGQPWWRMGSY